MRIMFKGQGISRWYDVTYEDIWFYTNKTLRDGMYELYMVPIKSNDRFKELVMARTSTEDKILKILSNIEISYEQGKHLVIIDNIEEANESEEVNE